MPKYIFTGCQTTVPKKSQATQCTILEDFFTSSTPVQSEDELSESDEEMEADDPSYVPDPDEIDADDDSDFDDCLYE